MNQFHKGLAEIIEVKMDHPEQCLSEVKKYYRDHQELIARVRAITEEQYAASLKEAERFQGGDDFRTFETQLKQIPDWESAAPEASLKYTQVLQEFVSLHPHAGLQVAALAAQFVPGVDVDDELRFLLESE